MNFPAAEQRGINRNTTFSTRPKGRGIRPMRSRLLRIGISSTLQFQFTIIPKIVVSLI